MQMLTWTLGWHQGLYYCSALQLANCQVYLQSDEFELSQQNGSTSRVEITKIFSGTCLSTLQALMLSDPARCLGSEYAVWFDGDSLQVQVDVVR